MQEDYLKKLKYLGLISRLKRLSEKTLSSGRDLYQFIDLDIEPNWYLIFKLLLEEKESTITELAKNLNFAHPTVISIVRKMEKNGYLIFKSDKIDKRKQLISLSQKALKKMPEIEEVWEAGTIGLQSIFKTDSFIEELDAFEKALENESFSRRALKNYKKSTIKYLPYERVDAEAFSALNKAWVKKYFHLEKIDIDMLDNPDSYIIEPGGHIIMAIQNKKAVGTLALIKHSNTTAELSKMAVDPASQGLGIGNQLLKEAIAYCREKNYKYIILYSNTKLSPAINLYKKHNFKEEFLDPDSGYERANIKMKFKL